MLSFKRQLMPYTGVPAEKHKLKQEEIKVKSKRFCSSILSILIAFALLIGCATTMKKAENLEKKKDYEGAIAAYQQAIAVDPSSNNARKAQLAMGKIYIEKLNKPEEGLAVYQKLSTDAPKSEEAAEALYQTGIYYFRAEDYKKAQEFFGRVVNEFAESKISGNAQLMQAKSYEKAKEYDKAASLYDSVVQRDPKDKRAVTAMQLKGKLYESIGEKDKATETYQELVKKHGADISAQETVEEAKKKLQESGAEVPKPDMPTAEERRRAQQEATRERDRPRTGLGTRERSKAATPTSSFGVNADALMPNISMDDQGTYYDAMFMWANVNFQDERYREAGALYERSIQLGLKDENLSVAYRNIATCYRKIGLADKSREMLKKGSRKNPKLIDEIIDSGDYRYTDGDYDDALELYNSVLGLSKTKDAEIYHHMGLVYKRLKDADKEIEAYEKSLAINPTYKEVLQLMAEALAYRKGDRERAEIFQDAYDGKSNYMIPKTIADISYKHGRYGMAKAKYKAAVRAIEREKKKLLQREKTKQRDIDRLDEQMLLMKVRAAVVSAKTGKFDVASQEINELAADNPDAAAIHYGLGDVALIQGKTEEGIAELKKAVELSPWLFEPNFLLGEYYIAQGNKAEALEIWDAYLKKNRTDKMMRGRVRELRKELEPKPEQETPEAKQETSPEQETPD